jgi:exodeoxyribonuclease VII large subunit
MSNGIFSISELNNVIKNCIDDSFELQNLLIKGEISNLTKHSTGHWYFSLKDENAAIKAVFLGASRRVIEQSKYVDGTSIIVEGSITFYQKSGSIQINVKNISLEGAGLLNKIYEELKNKLEKEGLFAESHKKILPIYPKKIGVITAPTGDAVHDIINTLQRRFPILDIIVLPTLVQGESAAISIINTLIKADKMGFDTLIIARGGGSLEDLWPFNNEDLARTIYALNTPIVSGVGHEPDFTLVDYVVDVRGATPTAASEKATPNYLDILNNLQNYKKTISKHLINQLTLMRLKLNNFKSRPLFIQKDYLYREYFQTFDGLSLRFTNSMQSLINNQQDIIKNKQALLKSNMQNLLNNKKNLINYGKELNNLFKINYINQSNTINILKEKLNSLNPRNVLERGYAILKVNNQAITNISQLSEGVQLEIETSKHRINTIVKGVEKK